MLVPVAVQVVLMSFRTGTYVHDLAERLSPTFDKSESWTYIFPGLKESEAGSMLDDFHSTNVRAFPGHDRIVKASSGQRR
jgi:hypothetical protein